MGKTPDSVSVQVTLGVRGPDGKWAEIGTATVTGPVVAVPSPPVGAPPLMLVPESAVFDPPAKRCADCGLLLRPAVDSVVGTERGLVHVHCPERTP